MLLTAYLKEWEEAGAGAIVLKSLFEEEIEAEADQVQEGSHTEELDYVKAYYRAHRLSEYLNLIKEAKAQCTIPIIASINCFRLTEWTEFAKQIEDAGADALELNIMSVNTEIFDEYGSFERMHIQIIDKVKQVVNIPIIVKLGKNLTNPMPLIHYLQVHGAEGIVLFNRMTTPDIHLETMTYTYYQNNVKPKPETDGKKGYVCKVCGFVYEGDQLPEDYICPLCKHGASDFEEIK